MGAVAWSCGVGEWGGLCGVGGGAFGDEGFEVCGLGSYSVFGGGVSGECAYGVASGVVSGVAGLGVVGAVAFAAGFDWVGLPLRGLSQYEKNF